MIIIYLHYYNNLNLLCKTLYAFFFFEEENKIIKNIFFRMLIHVLAKNSKTQFTILQKDINCIEKSTEDNNTTLYITGIANSGKKDLVDDILTQEALEKITQQAPLHNLHLDHDKTIDGIIGTIESAQLLDEGVEIKASILPEYQDKIKHLLGNGVKLGLSVSGNCVRDSVDLDSIIDWELVEISLTPIPCDQNTMGTVTVSKSLADFIQTIHETNNDKKMNHKSEDTIMAEEITKEDIIELINTAFAEKQEEMLETIRNEIKDEFQVTIDEMVKRIEALESVSGQEGNGGEGGEGATGGEGTTGGEGAGEGGKNGEEDEEEDEEKLKSFIEGIVKSTVETMNKSQPSQKKPLFKYESGKNKKEEESENKSYSPEDLAKLL